MNSHPAMPSFEILTLNCWALKPVSKYRTERIRAIAELLAQLGGYDAVCLQEIWVREDFDHVSETVRAIWPHGKFFTTGALGAGLAILSRYPVLESTTIPYILSGRPLGFSDFYVNKAAGSIMIDHPDIGELDIYTTHMNAGGPEGYTLGNSYRASQAWQLSKFITRSARQGRYALVCGDFNFQSNELPYRVMRDFGQVKDAWIEFAQRRADARGLFDDGGRDGLVKRWDMVGKPLSSAELAIEDAGVTVDSPINTWTWGKDIPPEVQRTQGKRLDYIFHRPPTLPSRCSSSLSHSQAPSVELVCVESEVVIKDLVPGQAYSYSDHFGLRAKFDIVTSQEQVLEPSCKPLSDESATSRGGSEESANSASSSTPLTNLDSGCGSPREHISNTAEEFEQALHHHRQVHQRHSKQLLALLPSAVVVLIALTVASAFLPLHSYLAPIFVFIGGLAGVGGVTALVNGFVWGRWEDGSLRRTLEELQEEKARLGFK